MQTCRATWIKIESVQLDFRPQYEPLTAPGQIDHHLADLTVTASADLTLQQLQDRLAEAEQWVPIDGDPSQTLGTLVETNSTGPLRLGYGAWRDLLLGMQLRTPGGKLITAGGRTMKNVAGYDVTKFMVGQHGLFGQIITITTRTYRRPTGSLLVRFAASAELIGQFLPTPKRPHWAMLCEGSLFCGYFGDEFALDFYEKILQPHSPLNMTRQSLREDIAFRASHWLPMRQPVRFRATVPPAQVIEFIHQAHLREFAADAAFGVVVGSYAPTQKTVLFRLAHDLGGKVIFDGPSHLSDFSSGAELELLTRIQKAFEA